MFPSKMVFFSVTPEGVDLDLLVLQIYVFVQFPWIHWLVKVCYHLNEVGSLRFQYISIY